MAGVNQHFIPQSLLRGFGAKRGRKGKVVGVTAYSHDHGIFEPPTDGIAAKRYFYSELGDISRPTLDHRITNYEGHLASLLAHFRAVIDNEAVDAHLSSELIAHLTVRNDYFRKVASACIHLVTNRIIQTIATEVHAKTLLGLNTDQPLTMLMHELTTALERNLLPTNTNGPTDKELYILMTEALKSNFEIIHQESMKKLRQSTAWLSKNALEIAANAQCHSLGTNLTPTQWVAHLKLLNWRVFHTDTMLVLPDCIAIGVASDGASLPLIFANDFDLVAVYMPLASDRLLVGSLKSEVELPSNLNAVFASCAWDFFVARDQSPEFEKLRDTLRSRTLEFFEKQVEDILNEEMRRFSGPGTRP